MNVGDLVIERFEYRKLGVNSPLPPVGTIVRIDPTTRGPQITVLWSDTQRVEPLWEENDLWRIDETR